MPLILAPRYHHHHHHKNSHFFEQVGLIESGYLICGGTYVLGNDGYVKVITAAHCLRYVILDHLTLKQLALLFGRKPDETQEQIEYKFSQVAFVTYTCIHSKNTWIRKYAIGTLGEELLL